MVKGMAPLLKPGSLEAAELYVGTTLKKWWEATSTSDAGWYQAEVKAAHDDVVNGDSGELEEGIQLTLSYEDGDVEDIWWEEVFGEGAKVQDVQLPEAAIANQKKLQQELALRERPPLKACNNRTMTPSGTGKRPACQMAARSAKRRAALDDTALKARPERAVDSDQEEPEDITPMMQKQPRWGRTRSRRASPVEEAEPEEDVAEPAAASDDEEVPADEEEREGSPAVAPPSPADEADEEPEPAPRVGRRRSRSRQPEAAAAAASQLPASQALTQRRPTQRTLTQMPRLNFPQLQPGNGVGMAGQVKSVHAENFMSHQNFEIEFGPHLNFITGENGSGKSATLQCLQVCLGARARDTGRSTTAKELINYKASTAVAKTVLWNTGADAYQPELYGPTITISRKLTRSGGSFYYLGAHGQKAMRQVTKSDVAAIIQDHFNIDASNPIICLTQDRARSFAANATDEEKYSLYMAATGFDTVLSGLQNSAAQVAAWKERLKAAKEQLDEKQKRIKEIEGIMQEMAEVDSWQAEVEHLDKCIAWAGVLDIRGDIDRNRVQVEEDLPRCIAEATEGVQEKEAALEEANADFNAKKAENQRLEAEMQEHVAEARRLEKLTKSTERTARQAALAAAQAATALGNKREELDNARRTEEDLQQQHMQATQDEAEVHARELKEKEQAAEAASAAASCASQALREAEALRAQLEKDLHERQDIVREADRRVKELQRELGQLTGSQGDPIAKFGGQDAQRLVAAIDAAVRQGKFQKRPIGPLGAHLSLSDERWAAAVDAAIGSCFDSFLVHSLRDLNELIDITKRLRVKRPTITVFNFDHPPHDQSRRPQLPPDVLTIQKVLRLPEDADIARVLRNYLLDYESIERRVLVPDADTGLDMIRKTDFFRKVGGRPMLANDAWALNAWRGYARGPSETSMDWNGPKRSRLTRDVQGQVAELEAEMAAARDAYRAAQQAAAQARRDDAEAKQNVERLRKERGAADRRRAQTQSQLEDLRASAEDAAAADAADPDNAEEIERLQEEINELQRALAEMTAKEAEASAKAAEAKEAKEAQAEANQAGLRQMEDVGEAFQEAIRNKQAASDALEDQRTRLQDLQNKQEESQRQLKEATRLLEELSAQAEQVCTEEEAAEARQQLKELWLSNKHAGSEARAEALLARDEMQTRVHALRRDITRRERDVGTNLDALKVELQRLRGWHAAKDADWRLSLAAFRRFREAYHKRQAKHEEVRDNVAAELNSQFNKYLKLRKWRGAIKINQEEGKLTIYAQQDSQQGKAESDLKTLSGGERSYVTVCYLLALCKKLQGSFHALDEFDVFMDNINRGRSLMMIMDFAVRHKDTQLILLTPLNMGAINDAAKQTKQQLTGADWPEPDFMRIRQMFPAQRDAMCSQADA